MVLSKPAHNGNGFVIDEMSLAFPSILQIGDTEFVHGNADPSELNSRGSNYEHFMFITPCDDQSFMMFTVDYYTGPQNDFCFSISRITSNCDLDPQRNHMFFYEHVIEPLQK